MNAIPVKWVAVLLMWPASPVPVKIFNTSGECVNFVVTQTQRLQVIWSDKVPVNFGCVRDNLIALPPGFE